MGSDLAAILQEGEGQKIEFKEGFASLAPEMVAFANAGGGRIYIGITDQGTVIPVALTNRLKSQIHDTARNCDPPIAATVSHTTAGVIVVDIAEGTDKPYKCREGFFLRVGPTTQKLKRDEVVHLIQHAGKIRYDEMVNDRFVFPKDFDEESWARYRTLAGYPATMQSADTLVNIGVATTHDQRVRLMNAAVLFFAKDPQRFFPEAKVTCLKYHGDTRFDIIDRHECTGHIVRQLEESLAFFARYNATQLKITGAPRHEAWEDYPAVALREAMINALVHRDYFYDSSHIYLHMYDGHLELDNPGGLIAGLTAEALGTTAARRNRMLADLMQRAGYIENAGTGIARIREALRKNNNPAPEIIATNFFSLRLIARPKNLTEDDLTDRQRRLYAFITQRGTVSTGDCQAVLGVGTDTTLSELKLLLAKGLLQKTGKGRSTRYRMV